MISELFNRTAQRQFRGLVLILASALLLFTILSQFSDGSEDLETTYSECIPNEDGECV